MNGAFLIGRVELRLDIDSEDDVLSDLSALACDADGNLWLGSDEGTTVQRLEPRERGVFAGAASIELATALQLEPDDKGDIGEIDIEGMGVDGSTLWLTGSHTSTRKKPKGKSDKKDLKRLTEVRRRPNRYIVAKLQIGGGELAGPAARLPFSEDGNVLTHALRTDPHLGPFLHIPRPDEPAIQLASKENGFDIEGLAVHDKRVFLGLRGPVLRGFAALVLEIQPRDAGNGVLALDRIGDDGRPYRKHFVDLEGMGIRDLCWDGDDLLILAGPTMDLTGQQTLWRFRDAAELDDDSLTRNGDKALNRVFDLPQVRGADKAEGIERYDELGGAGVLVAYDAPSEARKLDKHTVLADAFRLPRR